MPKRRIDNEWMGAKKKDSRLELEKTSPGEKGRSSQRQEARK